MIPRPVLGRFPGWLFAAAAAMLLTLAAPAPAPAQRPLLTMEKVITEGVPGGQIEGACGVATAGTRLYVSDYYHHAVDAFGNNPFPSTGGFLFGIPTDPLDGACGLAANSTGALYANLWHRGVVRLLPSALTFDSAESTGVALGQPGGEIFANDRTYVAAYQPSGAPVLVAGEPLRIGLGTLGDSYGVAASNGRVYVADAADRKVKVYEPAVDSANPVLVIDGADTPQKGFNSLVDSAIAIDASNGHILVLDNLQPGFEHPEAAIDEFDAFGNYLGQAAHTVIDGEPSGLTVSAGSLYVTSGNDEGSNVFLFGPYVNSPAEVAETFAGEQAAAAPAAASAQVRAASPIGPPPPAPTLRILSSAPSPTGPAVTIQASASVPGVFAVTGRGLRSLRPHRVDAGAFRVRLRLKAAAARSLRKTKLGRIGVPASFSLRSEIGEVRVARRVYFEDGGRAR